MGPPSYGRTQSQPYQVPLAMLERKLGERERRQEESSSQVRTSPVHLQSSRRRKEVRYPVLRSRSVFDRLREFFSPAPAPAPIKSRL